MPTKSTSTLPTVTARFPPGRRVAVKRLGPAPGVAGAMREARRHEEAPAPSAVASAVPVPTPATTARVPVGPPVAVVEAGTPPAPAKPENRASVLAGIAGFQAIIRHRMTVGRQTDEACEARTNAEEPRLALLHQQVGEDRMRSLTRFSSREPNLTLPRSRGRSSYAAFKLAQYINSNSTGLR